MSSKALTKFRDDVEEVLERLEPKVSPESMDGLGRIRDRLLDLRRSKRVKINHSVLELLVASYLLEDGYEVQVEYPLSDVLICDVYATRGGGSFVVEIETGYTPPSHALDPKSYNRARIASKIARYSSFGDRFALAAPPYYIMPVADAFTRPPRYRKEEEVKAIKGLCDRYYSNPPITEEEILNARLHTVLILDVDSGRVEELQPGVYVEETATLSFNHIPRNLGERVFFYEEGEE